jgi:hypothetical protein
MKSVKDIRELTNKAYEVKHSNTGLYSALQQEFRAKKVEIERNRDYTPQGRQKLIQSLEKKYTTKLMHLSRAQRGLFDKYLKEAKKEAEDLIHSKAPKVDPIKQERFEKRLGEFKTELMLANPKRGTQLLKDFIRSIDEQAFASRVKDEFSTIISPILNNESKPEIAAMFEDVRTKSQNPETAEAQSLLEFTEGMMNGRFFDQLVEEKAGENLGDAAKTFVNDPDSYFEIYPEEDKPQTDLKTVEEVIEESNAKH